MTSCPSYVEVTSRPRISRLVRHPVLIMLILHHNRCDSQAIIIIAQADPILDERFLHSTISLQISNKLLESTGSPERKASVQRGSVDIRE